MSACFWRLVVILLLLGTSLAAPAAQADEGPRDGAPDSSAAVQEYRLLPGGARFYSQAGGGGDRGFAVANDDEAAPYPGPAPLRFLDMFEHLGGVAPG